MPTGATWQQVTPQHDRRYSARRRRPTAQSA
jgi:hypothetical protein